MATAAKKELRGHKRMLICAMDFDGKYDCHFCHSQNRLFQNCQNCHNHRRARIIHNNDGLHVISLVRQICKRVISTVLVYLNILSIAFSSKTCLRSNPEEFWCWTNREAVSGVKHVKFHLYLYYFCFIPLTPCASWNGTTYYQAT